MKVMFHSNSNQHPQQESLSMPKGKFGRYGKKAHRSYDDEEQEQEIRFSEVRDAFIKEHANDYDDRLLQIIAYELRPTGPKSAYRSFNKDTADKLKKLMTKTLEDVMGIIDDASDEASTLTKRQVAP